MFTDTLPVMNDGNWWSPQQLYTWALNQPKLRLTGRVPLDHWPAAKRAATYAGTVDLDKATATCWQTPTGTVALIWPTSDDRRGSLKKWAHDLFPRGEGAAILVTGMFYLGPDIDGFLPGRPQDGRYSPVWADVARVLGASVPYWAPALRDPDLIRTWKPGALPVTALARGSIDSAPLLQLAATYPRDDMHSIVLTNLAQQINQMAHNQAEFALDILGENRGLDPEHLIVAARPLDVPAATSDDIDAVVRKAAWHDIQARSDALASSATMLYQFVDGGTDLANSSAVQVDPSTSAHAQEWARRLRPCQRTAAHNVLHDDSTTESLTDPETDAPVIREHDQTLVAAVPQALPARAPLAELILDDPIWIRTADGTIWPAPRDSYYGLSWGYHGSGPGSLALLIDRLLDDINTRAADDINGASDGLERLTATPLPEGTVLSREDLEAAREGRWIPVFTTDDEDER
ncbi:hypothetical protein ADL15_07070 [Actinoplanes awajinensis subsp. mycoplanecinus]|uniref:Uncharacterized protein n=1 Tax=Actinoplanes awajinensis subsp. mycoplanecinus TaxID=135947 RepID=A0A0X3V6W2_9ACTN|nr:hypothetical protein ADL15_07070 [Actinoplanes awajinensis subsp. mycoplanecinus]